MNAPQLPRLVAVNSTLPDPPYPADTSVAGTPFSLDFGRIMQSDTWALTASAPELRPWLLMVWVTAWVQTPAGSFTDDDSIIAARLGMPLTMFQTHRKILLRGWYKCSDGRLYHPVISGHVAAKIVARDAWRNRQAKKRHGSVTRDSTVSPRRDCDCDGDCDGDKSSTSKSKTPVAVAPNTAPKPPRNGTAVRRLATRLPDGFQIPEAWIELGHAIRPDWSRQGVVRESVTFRDYWTAKAGKDATKVDWLATWRTWIRRADREPLR